MYYEYFAINVCVHMLVLFLSLCSYKTNKKIIISTLYRNV